MKVDTLFLMMYERIDVDVFGIPLRFDLNAMKALEDSLGANWQQKIHEYDLRQIADIYLLLMKEGLRYYAYMGNVRNYKEPNYEELLLKFLDYPIQYWQGFLIRYIQECTLTEEDMKEIQRKIDCKEDEIRPVRGVKREPEKTDFYFYFYFARKEFNFTREETGFLFLIEWKKFYKAYQNKFDMENSLRIAKTTYSQLEAESRKTIDDELGGYKQ